MKKKETLSPILIGSFHIRETKRKKENLVKRKASGIRIREKFPVGAPKLICGFIRRKKNGSAEIPSNMN